MATVQELMSIGEKMGLKGSELRTFIKEEQAAARELREKERVEKEEKRQSRERILALEMAEREKDRAEKEKERQYELDKIKLFEATKRMELQAKVEESMNRSLVAGEADDNKSWKVILD